MKGLEMLAMIPRYQIDAMCVPNELIQSARQPVRNPKCELLHGVEFFLRSHQSLSYSEIVPHFMYPEGSFVHQPVIGPYREPGESNPYHLILFIILI
jgi:hypothetical protein